VVEADQMGGSIKKGQIGHFIMSVAKSLTQKENGTANIAILKSRFGKDGLVFNDVVFRNDTIQVDISKDSGAQSFMDRNTEMASNSQDRVNAVLAEAKIKRALEAQRAIDAQRNANSSGATSLPF
jgi:hypothetical protein